MTPKWLSASVRRPALVAAAAVVGACALSAGPHDDLRDPGPIGRVAAALSTGFADSPVPSVTSTPPTGVALTVANLDQFVDYAATAVNPQVPDVAARIYAARCAPPPASCAILDALIARLNASGRTFIDRLTTITIVGELGDARAKDPLVAYVNATLPDTEPRNWHDPSLSSSREVRERLDCRAVEALAFLATSDALAATLAIVAGHPSQAVRAAAALAYIYNSSDETAARSVVRSALPSGEKHHADRFFKVRGMSSAEFQAKVDAYYSAWPAFATAEPVNTVSPPTGQAVPLPPHTSAPPVTPCPPNTVCNP